jgi:hypothetical protein
MSQHDMVDLDPAREAEDRRTRSINSCLETARRWRREGENLRAHAQLPHLTEQSQGMLLHEAASADASAAYWEDGARDYGHVP